MFGSLLSPVVNKRALYLIYVSCVYLRVVVSNIYFIVLCCVLLFFVLCTLCCQFLWIVNFWLLLRYSLSFIYLNNLLILALNQLRANGTQQKAHQLQLNNLILFFCNNVYKHSCVNHFWSGKQFIEVLNKLRFLGCTCDFADRYDFFIFFIFYILYY